MKAQVEAQVEALRSPLRSPFVSPVMRQRRSNLATQQPAEAEASGNDVDPWDDESQVAKGGNVWKVANPHLDAAAPQCFLATPPAPQPSLPLATPRYPARTTQ